MQSDSDAEEHMLIQDQPSELKILIPHPLFLASKNVDYKSLSHKKIITKGNQMIWALKLLCLRSDSNVQVYVT